MTKTYGATRALRGVSLELRPGRVHGLVGVNGSGKSTLMKIIAGVERATSGQMSLDGKPYQPRSVKHAGRSGVTMVPQELPIVRGLSVADNIVMGNWPTRAGVIQQGTQIRDAGAALAEIGAVLDLSAPAGDLTLGDQQLVVLARTLFRRSRVVLLDEPTSALGAAEVTHLLEVIRTMAAQGHTVMIVSQRLDDIFGSCDHIMVLRDGRIIESADVDGITSDEVVDLMLYGSRRSRPAVDDAATGTGPAGSRGGRPGASAPALAVSGAVMAGRRTTVDVTIDRGEIVGFAGLPGSGSSQLLRTLFGLTPLASGDIRLFGERYRANRPAAAVRSGVAYVPGDRQVEGLIPDLSVAGNIATVRDRSILHGPWALARTRRAALDQISALHIMPGEPDVPVRSLSGGNQQKTVFARWALVEPRLWLLDDATRGVDIGARRDIHEEVRRRIREGETAAAVVSSDVLELFEVCDRIVVFRQGAIVGRFAAKETTASQVESLAAGTLNMVS
ncbi:MAG: sugar ABC transporter ATP-binding protein [Acidimicrobiales bacterium]